MQLLLHPNDGVPIYRQIVSQVKYLVAAGRLRPGDELPPIRTLASQLVVNPNTIARAYLELEHAGLVSKRHGSGTYIAENGSTHRSATRFEALHAQADALLAEAARTGIELDQLIELLRARQGMRRATPRKTA